MIKLWQRYKPFINAGVQELITYRVNFILYRIGYEFCDQSLDQV